jgi:hypothetical protein
MRLDMGRVYRRGSGVVFNHCVFPPIVTK